MGDRMALQGLAVGGPLVSGCIAKKQIDREAQGTRILAANHAGQLGDGQWSYGQSKVGHGKTH
jgi:outer membrane murein-binding lipoprotein Lpp